MHGIYLDLEKKLRQYALIIEWNLDVMFPMPFHVHLKLHSEKRLPFRSLEQCAVFCSI